MQFRSPEHALRFAYEMTNRPIVKLSSVNSMRENNASSRGGNDELTAHDRHAQAAMIISMCERTLSPVHMAYITVQFGRDASGIDLLAQHVAANFGTGLHRRRGIELLIRAFCGERAGLHEMRKLLSCGMLATVSYRNRTYDVLEHVHAQVMDTLGREMDRTGLRMDAAFV